MISITYSGWVAIFCLFQIAEAACFAWFVKKIRTDIKNHKDQMMIDNRSLAALINK